MLAKQRQKDAIQLVKLKQPRKMIMGDARLFHSLLPPISFMLSYTAKPPRIQGGQLVDISKLDLNSKIKKFSYSFICGNGYSPPSRGRIAFVYSLTAPYPGRLMRRFVRKP